MCLSASTQGMAERLFRVIGRTELMEDPAYSTNAARVVNAGALERIIGSFIQERTLAENVRFFSENDVTVGPVHDISGIVEDDYVAGREVLVRMPDEDLGTIAMHNIAPRFSGSPGALRRPAPTLGQHNLEVLSGIGIGASELDNLIIQGVVADHAQKAM
jgi:formyl-CoA transferase